MNIKDNDFKTMKDSKNIFKRLGFIGIGLCAACCLLPIAAALFGTGALAFISGFVELAGLVAIGVAIVFFSIYYMRRTKVPACDIDRPGKGNKDMKVEKR